MTNREPPPTEAGPWGMIVGVDGSPGSRHALRWAMTQTAQFGPIRPVTTWHFPWWLVPHPFPPPGVEGPMIEFQRLTEGQVERELDSMGVEQCARPVVIRGSAGPTLVEVGTDANLIVVGTHSHGAALDALLGSVSTHVVAHASSPVAVVPLHADIERPARRVVVGVDGSAGSIAALVWAIRWTPDNAVLEAVHTWNDRFSTLPASRPVEALEAEARQLLDEAVVEATLLAGGSRHTIVHRLERGDPRDLLRLEVAGLSEPVADLLVLGARGRGGIAGLLVGSTTMGLIHRPPATTIVVPSARG